MDSQPFLHSQIYNGYGIQDNDVREKVGARRRLPLMCALHAGVSGKGASS